MCAGALVLARVDRLVFGAYDDKAGAVGSLWTWSATVGSTTGPRSSRASGRGVDGSPRRFFRGQRS